MPKIEINKVAEILKKNVIDPKTLRAAVEEMNHVTQADAAEERLPSIKKQFAILVSDPEGIMPDKQLAGWVLQIPESESLASVDDRIARAVLEYNKTRKGRMYPVRTVGEALESIPPRHLKELELWVRTRTPVLVLRTDNEIPRQ